MKAENINTVKKLIEFSESEQIWLPEFQRPFVWDDSQIKLLVDSLYHNYTISSILIWDGSDELARRRIGGSIKDIKIPEHKSSKSVTYLLDGQQRASALMSVFSDKTVFKGSNTKKTLNIDLYFDSEYSGDDPELRFIYDNETLFEEGKNEKDGGVTLNSYDNQSDIFKKYGARFIKLQDVFKKDTAKLIKLINNNDIYVEYDKQLSDLNEKVLQKRIDVIEQTGKLEDVLEVFERINTRNTKLNIFDIMVAKTYRKYEEGIFDLRTYLQIINCDKKIKNDFFYDKDNIDYENFKIDEYLDESLMLFLLMIILRKEFVAKEILKITSDDLKNNIKFIHNTFHHILETLESKYEIKKKEAKYYQTILKFITAFTVENGGKLDDSINKIDFLKKWLWNTVLYNRYPGAQNERIAKDYELIKSSKDYNKSLNTMLKDRTRNFDGIRNCTIKAPKYFDAFYDNKNQQIYTAFSLLLINRHPKDFQKDIIPIVGTPTQNKLNEHHIFPTKSEVGKEIFKNYENSFCPNILNNIANIAYITEETNKKILNLNPSDYITEFEKAYKKEKKHEEFIRIMKSQFINEDMIQDLKEDNFESFLYKRTKLLINRIDKLCELTL